MATVAKPPTLVVLQLTGGNDPLNTVIPYGDPLYRTVADSVVRSQMSEVR